MIKVFYFGYRRWARSILLELLRHKNNMWRISEVFSPTQSDESFDALGIPHKAIDPKNIYSPMLWAELALHKPAVLLFYGWSWMIPPQLYEHYTCLILHPSPLPKYRGGSPIQNQIIAGETTSAVSIIATVAAVDAGDIYAQLPFSLKGNLSDIFARIVKGGTKTTKQVLDEIATSTAHPHRQDTSQATTAKRRKPSESEITTDEIKTSTARELYNKIRALGKPYPLPYIVGKDGKKVLITGAKLDPHEIA